ncbi:MAG TPA: AsnC family transcriptional regulator [Porphyromonadaceae bacterium]|jgi:Lrp/AsnC family leucine-responsive transcriptional regulator|uniref:Lrp/AsnC family transcriptional regulator n=1 Tax=Limibacterium fermenti TaxID=3229863 RepID=UPI000E97DA01|nr:AsnC family transcriptional regulator [Porphyromonadaceae bacterium]HBK31756.1 AsnC family transcriptional regulator [Porphyromonadaceae bacterium]HBL33237.1 AsnC family transcriptional regulator [Porphyromonadaceae bacterium]HBX21511.1 AsnC family transcriptional regulator [Porphyromonadaceae bacterium]HBX45274.1 AsnC family transcriptional regulator [Porphyromonadaceae bacterium]
MAAIDETDIKLLTILQESSNLTTKEIASQVNLSPTPVFERIKKLEKEGYIKKYIAVLDEEKLNNGFAVFCNIRLKQHSKEYGKEFISAVMSIKEITECYNTSGEYDFMVKIHVKDMKHYQDFVLNTLGGIDCIGHLNSTFVLGTIKQQYAIPI